MEGMYVCAGQSRKEQEQEQARVNLTALVTHKLELDMMQN